MQLIDLLALMGLMLTATAITFVWVYFLDLDNKTRRIRKSLINWVRNILSRLNIVNRGFYIKVGTMELMVHPRNFRPKLYIQRYGKGN